MSESFESMRTILLLLLHPFNGLLSWVSWHQKSKPFWIFLLQWP